MRRVIIPAEAWNEVFASAEWYDQQRPGLGSELMQEVENALLTVRKNPLQFPVVDQDARCARIN